MHGVKYLIVKKKCKGKGSQRSQAERPSNADGPPCNEAPSSTKTSAASVHKLWLVANDKCDYKIKAF